MFVRSIKDSVMRVVIIGYGAQAKYVLEIFQRVKNVEVVGLLDISQDKRFVGRKLRDIAVIGGIEMLEKLVIQKVKRAIVCCADTRRKEAFTKHVVQVGFKLLNAIHPASVIATNAQIGEGVIINAGAIIQSDAVLGDGVMVHAGVIIEHDNQIKDFANLAPGVKLSGWVTVGKRATIYTGASVAPQVSIGHDAIVGAGAVVLKDVPNNGVAFGVPARLIRYRGL